MRKPVKYFLAWPLQSTKAFRRVERDGCGQPAAVAMPHSREHVEYGTEEAAAFSLSGR